MYFYSAIGNPQPGQGLGVGVLVTSNCCIYSCTICDIIFCIAVEINAVNLAIYKISDGYSRSAVD